ncbi:MAG TPA: hypothetical protein VHH36_01450, partial [Candidatus Thermoplasmatota archaeon]|nr:hypothetical protein [Candidatus Thermoplasmatota archaeon]
MAPIAGAASVEGTLEVERYVTLSGSARAAFTLEALLLPGEKGLPTFSGFAPKARVHEYNYTTYTLDEYELRGASGPRPPPRVLDLTNVEIFLANRGERDIAGFVGVYPDSVAGEDGGNLSRM